MDKQLPARTVSRLKTLLERRRRLEAQCTKAADELTIEVLRASEAGASRSQIAKALGVGTSTVQGWVERGRQVRQR